MNNRTRIKMCGTCNIEDALVSVQLGVDALGFIFVEQSKRYITPEESKSVCDALPPFINKVGVFVNESHEEVKDIAQYLGLNTIQLHGSEEPSFCTELAKALPSCSVLKAFRVGDKSTAADFSAYYNVVDGFLLDTYVKDLEGGTGLTFNWGIIEQLKLRKPFILAGGLSPSNIKEALAVARPYCVDINSGVEHSPRKKNHSKVEKLVNIVAEFDLSIKKDKDKK